MPVPSVFSVKTNNWKISLSSELSPVRFARSRDPVIKDLLKISSAVELESIH